MDLNRITEALQGYTGQEDSMYNVANVLTEELGENWPETVFQDLVNLPPALKDNLTHAFNYYAATMAWNETQQYLVQKDLKDDENIHERLPILKHWLDFFGAPGMDAYQQLEDRLAAIRSETASAAKEVSAQAEEPIPTQSVEEEVPAETGDFASLVPDEEGGQAGILTAQEGEADISNLEASEMNTEESVVGDTEDESSEMDEEEEEEASDNEQDTPEAFEVHRLEKQLALLEQAQAWIAARCIQLKNIEVYAYPFYGFIVDLMRQVLKNMETLEASEEGVAATESLFEGGMNALQNKKEAIQHDIELAEQNCESAVTALISEDTDMEEVKRTLGSIDASDTVEYVGPAPDGFELLDDDAPLDENAIKEQYKKLENADALTGVQVNKTKENVKIEENTSQNEQKGVQRKLSFSLKKKKPGEGTT